MDLAVAPARQDPLVPVVVAHDEERVIVVTADLDDLAGVVRHSDRSPVDGDAVADTGSHVDHLLAITIRRCRQRRQSNAAREFGRGPYDCAQSGSRQS
jgi:hypothetical protein